MAKDAGESVQPSHDIEVIKEYRPQDRTEIQDKDPNYRYYWDNRHKMIENGGPDRGYEVVHGNMRGNVEKGAKEFYDNGVPRDGSDLMFKGAVSMGDLVAVRCHKDFHESRKNHHRDVNANLLKAAGDVSGNEHFDSIRGQKVNGRRVMIQGGITR